MYIVDRNIKIVVVILHYKSSDDTISCVNSILNKNDSVINVVIVCNGSNDESDEFIYNKYFNYDNVHVIVLAKNLGFACGMNVGIKYGKEIGARIIVCANNDVEFVQNDFFRILESKYFENTFGVIGPDVINLDNIHQNPTYIPKKIKKYALNEYKKTINGIKRCKYFKGVFEYIFCIIKKVFPKNIKNIDKNSLLRLHGSCIIFGSEFLDVYKGFNDETFLYGEEEILTYMCFRKNISMQYCSELKILHKEAKSTKIVYKNTIKRHLMFYENYSQSLKILLKLIENEDI